MGVCVGLIFSPPTSAQIVTDVATAVRDADSEQPQQRGFFNNPNFLVVPFPVSNPTIGTGGAFATAMFFKIDEISSTSVIGAAGFYTNNGSWGAGLLASLSFIEDRYRLRALAGYADVNYEFFGVGSTAPSRPHVTLNQSGYLPQLLLQTRIGSHFYAGGQLRYVKIKTGFSDSELAEDLLGDDGVISNLENSVWSIGVVATFDSRNEDYSPDAGAFLETEFNFNTREFILSNHYLRLAAAYNRYDKIAPNLVLASRASLCAVNGNAAIFDLCLFGLRSDLRGYAVGQYQDKAMFALQAELRWRAFGRFGFVGFGGIGSVGQSLGSFDNLLAAGGVGIRFLASRMYGVNIGIDGTVNKNGGTALYFQIGEAF